MYDVQVFDNDSFTDHRGDLWTLYNSNNFPDLRFNHDKVAKSKKNVLRGLHTDKSWKLITCLYGKIQLIVVNFDSNSFEYLKVHEYILDSNLPIKKSVLVPPYFLNGHLVLSDEAIFHYKWAYQGDYPDVNDQISINWKDPKLKINWLCDEPVLSERDLKSKFIS